MSWDSQFAEPIVLPNNVVATTLSWSPEELRLLDKLVVDGASPRTAAEALNRSKETVRTKARRVGCPFPRRDEVKRQRPPAQEEVELPQLAR